MTGLHWEKYTHFTHYGHAGLTMFGYDPGRDESITGNRTRTFAEFHFDEHARELTEEALFGELPARIAPAKEGVSFQNLFDALTNETPATSDILKEVVRELAREGQLQVKDASGSTRHAGSKVRNSDIIIIPKQTRLILR